MYAGLFEEDGKLKPAGSHWVRPEYADALQILADEGDEPFYSGRIAEDIVKVVQERGGLLNMKDMESESIVDLHVWRLIFSIRYHVVGSYRGRL